jgi:hypothetical protein
LMSALKKSLANEKAAGKSQKTARPSRQRKSA